MKWTVLALALMGAPISTHGADYAPQVSFVSGDRLYEACQQNDPFCTTYVMAIADMVSLYSSWGDDPGVCIPVISARQVILAFQKWVAEHPEQLSNSAASSVRLGLRETFPCRENSN